MKSELEKFKRLCAAATAGPWRHHLRDDGDWRVTNGVPRGFGGHTWGFTLNVDESDAAFIAACREMVPKLLKLAHVVRCNPHPEPQAGCPICAALRDLESSVEPGDA